ncbi:MAG: DUF6142 family protein [Lachnospiraceae bacterium]|jgi:uncharacterized membrane protein HdeD (DUF308 family)|nr:DUF6142 family protein [Lachnospiraceae bacterium]
MSRKKGYIFTNKDHAKKGIMSTILGTISIGTLIFVLYFSYQRQGIIPERFAATALLALIFAFVGIALGFVGMTEKNRFRLFPGIGIGLNVIAIGLVSLILYAGAYMR